MKAATKKLRPPVKWHGGKTYLARRIIALFPEHKAYIEPFVGGGSTLLNTLPCEVEIACDINPHLINLWGCLRDHIGWLQDTVGRLEYNETNFGRALLWMGSEERAAQSLGFLVRNRFSRGGLGNDFAWSERLRGGQPGDRNAWETIVADLPAIAARIKNVKFHCSDGIEMIRRQLMWKDALFYCDPPYLPETRTAKETYAHEMTVEDHERMLEVLREVRGKVFLSGYGSGLYDQALKGWTRHDFEMPNHSGQGKTKQRRIECLWENHPSGA